MKKHIGYLVNYRFYESLELAQYNNPAHHAKIKAIYVDAPLQSTKHFGFIVRLFIGLPILCIAFIIWIVIFLFSDRALGRVLIKTGEGILK